ncbi:hypothetical protein KTE26_16305 [Ralstonia mannitolilytica]|nr:hypothetical protein [Ralstonia mannitolilytica]
MKVFKDCWASLGAFDCQYGAHLFDGSDAFIYVNHWLAVFGEIEDAFSRKNSEGLVGHCILVFRRVKRFDFVVTPYVTRGGEVSWQSPISFNYSGPEHRQTVEYELAGSLHGFASAVSISVEAREFELHVLEQDEPARQS